MQSVWGIVRKAWDGISTQENIEEFWEVTDVVSEVSEKVYSVFMDWIWEQGEIMIWNRRMQRAKDWKSWEFSAKKLDELRGMEDWKKRDASTLYDYKLLKRRLRLIRNMRENENIEALVHHLRSGLLRGLGGCLNPELYKRCLVGTKQIIQEYQEEVCKSLKCIVDSSKFPLKAKLTFFSESRYAFGKTALMLSGGASLGMYHLGVVKALYKKDLLPRVICGTSAGSIVAAMVGTTSPQDLPNWFASGKIKYGPFAGKEKGSVYRKLRRFLTSGHFMDIKVLETFVRANVGELTFQEAFEKTGIILNITVSESSEHQDYRLMNYLTAPHVLIWSAAIASCAIPLVFEPVELKCKNHKGEIVSYHPPGLKFIDGSVKADLPMQRLSELFNVNAFVVSQVNPWVIPLLTPDDGGSHGHDSLLFRLIKNIKKLILMEFRHRVQQFNLLGYSKCLSGFLGIFTQEYRGNVTIWPVPSVKDYLNILSNPSEEDIQRFIEKGMLRTFPKVNMVSSILAIEKTFEKCYLQIREKLQVDSVTLRVALKNQSEQIKFKEHHIHPGFSILPELKELIDQECPLSDND